MVRLKHVAGDALTIVRRRTGRGFGYLHPNGRTVRDAATRERVRQLAIPPAWQDVVIASDPLAHLQARGTDAAGRVQYIYHPEWERRRTLRKQRHLSALAAALPRVRARVERDLRAEAGDKALAIAIAVALIDRTAMRVGRERYLASNGTRGAGTLYARDVTVSEDRVRVRFPAKSGKPATYTIEDARLAAAIARIRSIPGRRLLMFRGADGTPRSLQTQDINTYLREITGAAVTAKDFRTLHASAMAGEELARLEPASSVSARRRQLAEVMRKVALFLQNTPSVTRHSYVSPRLVHLFEDGMLARAWSPGDNGRRGLRLRERCLACVICGAAQAA
jgi:DNA topoisomerase-1